MITLSTHLRAGWTGPRVGRPAHRSTVEELRMATVGEQDYALVLDWIHRLPRFSRNLSLDRFSRLLDALGNPERGLRFIHVAGTNGKGSVTAMAASVLIAQGYKTGMFISPDLEDFRERIMVNGRKVPRQTLLELAQEVRTRADEMVREGSEHPIQFEMITAMALVHFARERCDFVSFEVGLGGRFDATNVVSPLVSAITTIGLDHTEILGDTLAKIAYEKAGIIKPGVAVVTGVAEEEALEVIRDVAREKGAPLVTVGKDPGAAVTWEEISSSLDGQVIDVRGPAFAYDRLRIPLLGRHQQQNAATAVGALHAGLHAACSAGGDKMRLDEQSIRKGMASVAWPGRLEAVCRKPLIILDGAHNPEGAKALRDAVQAFVKKRLICVFGVLGDKSYSQVAASIAPLCDFIIATTPANPRALPPSALAVEAGKYTDAIVEPDPARAVDKALDMASDEDAVLCCGSLYLVGPVRTHLRKVLGLPEFGA